MNEEIKAQWLAALRSGGYTQGRGALITRKPGHTAHCCLGVLCEIAADAGVIERSVGVRPGFLAEGSEEGVQNGILPEAVRSWAGLTSQTGLLPTEVRVESGSAFDEDGGYELYVELTELNDEAGFSFEDIADVIEEQL